MPLARRVPKRGFHNKFALTVAIVNLEILQEAFQEGEPVTPETLSEKSVVRTRYDVLKILGEGALTKALTITAHRFSESARIKILQAGGQIIELPGKNAVVKQQRARKA